MEHICPFETSPNQECCRDQPEQKNTAEGEMGLRYPGRLRRYLKKAYPALDVSVPSAARTKDAAEGE